MRYSSKRKYGGDKCEEGCRNAASAAAQKVYNTCAKGCPRAIENEPVSAPSVQPLSAQRRRSRGGRKRRRTKRRRTKRRKVKSRRRKSKKCGGTRRFRRFRR